MKMHNATLLHRLVCCDSARFGTYAYCIGSAELLVRFRTAGILFIRFRSRFAQHF